MFKRLKWYYRGLLLGLLLLFLGAIEGCENISMRFFSESTVAVVSDIVVPKEGSMNQKWYIIYKWEHDGRMMKGMVEVPADHDYSDGGDVEIFYSPGEKIDRRYTKSMLADDFSGFVVFVLGLVLTVLFGLITGKIWNQERLDRL